MNKAEIKFFYPDIYMSYSKIEYCCLKTGIDFIDEDYWLKEGIFKYERI